MCCRASCLVRVGRASRNLARASQLKISNTAVWYSTASCHTSVRTVAGLSQQYIAVHMRAQYTVCHLAQSRGVCARSGITTPLYITRLSLETRLSSAPCSALSTLTRMHDSHTLACTTLTPLTSTLECHCRTRSDQHRDLSPLLSFRSVPRQRYGFTAYRSNAAVQVAAPVSSGQQS